MFVLYSAVRLLTFFSMLLTLGILTATNKAMRNPDREIFNILGLRVKAVGVYIDKVESV